LKNGPGQVALAGAGCPDWLLGNPDGHSHYVPRYDAALAATLRSRMQSLPAGGAVALMIDAAFLSESGLMPIGEALAWASAGLDHSSPIVRQYAVELVEKQRDAWLTPALARAKHELVEKKVVPMAGALGWEERSGDSDDNKVLRVALLPFAAEREEGVALRSEARRLALAWAADRNAVAANMVKPVLETAARFADAATYDKLEARLAAAQDLRERTYLLSALARVRDPALRIPRAAAFDGRGDAPARRAHLPRRRDGRPGQPPRGPRFRPCPLRAAREEAAAPHHGLPHLARGSALHPRGSRRVRGHVQGSRAEVRRWCAALPAGLETLDLCVAAHASPRSYN
jgi:hypothetical protein